MTVVINWAGSGETSECESVQAAEQVIEQRYPDAVYAEQWDADGWNDAGDPMERLVVWANEDSSENDDGAHSVCEISRVAK